MTKINIKNLIFLIVYISMALLTYKIAKETIINIKTENKYEIVSKNNDVFGKYLSFEQIPDFNEENFNVFFEENYKELLDNNVLNSISFDDLTNEQSFQLGLERGLKPSSAIKLLLSEYIENELINFDDLYYQKGYEQGLKNIKVLSQKLNEEKYKAKEREYARQKINDIASYEIKGYNKEGCNDLNLDRNGKPCIIKEGYVKGIEYDYLQLSRATSLNNYFLNGFKESAYKKMKSYFKAKYKTEYFLKYNVKMNSEYKKGFNKAISDNSTLKKPY